jgi:hypothetical protein
MSDEVKTINPSTLGRNRKRYETMKQLDGMTDKKVNEAMKLDIDLYNKQNKTSFTLDDYVKMLESLNKPSQTGKRDADKATRDELITQTQDLLSVVNLAVSSKRGEVTLSPKAKAKAFDVLGEFGDVLTNHLKTAFSPIGGMSMLWNPSSQVAEAKDGLSVYIGGWDDGSKNPRYQYAPRKCPISKRSGYRDDSFDVAIHDLNAKQTPKQETETEAEAEAEKTEAES